MPAFKAFMLLALLVPALPAAAQSTAPSPAPGTTGRFSDVVRRLADSDYAVRTRASKELAGLPPEAYDLFVKTIADPATDPEVRGRLTEALPAIEVKHAGQIAKARREEDRSLDRATALKAYDTVGNKDPRWDAAVHDGLNAYFDPSSDRPSPRAVESFKKALDAGCRDPIVLDLASALAFAQSTRDLPKIRAMADAAARGYAASAGGPKAYPASLRLQGYLFAIRIIKLVPQDAQEDRALLDHWLQEAMGTWPEVAAEPGLSSRRLYLYARTILDRAPDKDNVFAVRIVMTPVSSSVAGKFTYALLDGKDELKSAWFQRSRGQNISGYLQKAKMQLEQAASLDPLHPDPPNAMLELAVLNGMPRDEMETWFHRAMLANPDNLEACIIKLNYLFPQAQGTVDEMIAFGKECFAKGDFDTRVPTTLALAHQFVADVTHAGDEYFARENVWNDIHAAYAGMLKKSPGNLLYRSSDMKYAVLAGQWKIAAEDRAVIGDHPDLSVFKAREGYLELCRQIDQHVPTHKER
jgi:hypothetical protein